MSSDETALISEIKKLKTKKTQNLIRVKQLSETKSDIKNTERIILGIDPGTTIMGFGLIKAINKKMEFGQLNELRLPEYDDHYLKITLICAGTIQLIETRHPDEIALEAPFFGKNVRSMLQLGRAQGVAMAAGLSRQLPITEYE